MGTHMLPVLTDIEHSGTAIRVHAGRVTIVRPIANAVLAAMIAAWALAVPASPGSGAEPGRLGTNLARINYYDGAMIFADIVKQAGEWIPQREGGAWGSGTPLQLRPDGWPQSIADGQFATVVLAENHYPAGRYSVTWRGSGEFDINDKRFAGSGGSGHVDLDGTSIVLLNLRQTDSTDPLRDISVRAPGTPAHAVFHPDYLAQLAPYSVVRFMDWQRTNSTFADPQRTFRCASRVTPGYYSQGTSAGAAVETMVVLANALDRDPWFTIPHEASDDWVRCHAQVVATTLARHLTPRYEFSNETWNPTFRAFHDLSAEAAAAGLGGGDRFLGLQQRVGQRHNAVMDLVQTQMAANDRPFIRVLAGQAANSWVVEQRLATAGTKARTDEIAIAPYLGVGGNPFDVDEAAALARLDGTSVVQRLTANQSGEVDPWISAHEELARTSDKELVAYEGGQHLAGHPDSAALTRLFISVNRSSAMGELYDTYLERWRAATGNALMMHFTDVGPYSRFGSWGALETPEQAPTTSPKYEALLRFAGTLRPDPAPSGSPPIDPDPSTPGNPPDPEPGATPSRPVGMSIAGGRFSRSRHVVLSVRWPNDATGARVADRSDFRGARSLRSGAQPRWTLPRAERRVARHRLFLRFHGSSVVRTFSDSVMLDRARPRLARATAKWGAGAVTINSRATDQGSGLRSLLVAARPGSRAVANPDRPPDTSSFEGRYQPRVRVGGLPRGPLEVRVVDRAGNKSLPMLIRPT